MAEDYQDWGESLSVAKMEDYLFTTPEGAIKKSKEIGFDGEIHDSTLADGTKLYSPAKTEDEFIEWYRENDPDAEEELGAVFANETMEAAEYKGRKVTLNKPFRTPKQSKKFAVYVKNPKGNIIIVRFGDPNMEIKRDDPKRRKAFRDRHNCAEKKDKTTAGYWSCRQWSTNKVEANYDKSVDTLANSMCGCTDTVEAAMPTPNDQENHDDFMARCMADSVMVDEYGNEEQRYAVCMKQHEDHDFPEVAYHDDEKDKKASCDNQCAVGEELVDGECVRVAVTCEIEIEKIETRIEASTGKSVMRISGIAFTSGINKNNWGIRPELATRLTAKMVDSDVTLNHPKAEMGRFRRNMDGGVDEAVVGIVTEASYHATGEGYQVRYVAEVYRTELFASLESGLWMRPEYGVSIGGSGIPTEIIEAEKEGERPTMWFGEDFDFDHLAIVHHPAYPDANIETAEKITKEAAISDTDEVVEKEDEDVSAGEMFNNDLNDSVGQTKKVNKMTDDIVNNEADNKMAAEMEALKASMVLREARIAEFEELESKREEESRLSLVSTASELGLKGHEDFSADTLTSLIASWESSRPEPKAEVSMEATPATSAPEPSSPESNSVVANYLNGELLQTDENLYERAWNAWASAYNKSVDREAIPAPKYIEAKEMI